MNNLKLLNFNLNFVDYSDILELIKKDILKKGKFAQIISLNPENFMTMTQQSKFAKLVTTSQTLIPDGVGIVWAVKLLTGTVLTRLPGVELMDRLISDANQYRLRCLLIGGSGNLAELTTNCYQRQYPELTIMGIEGVKDINQPTKAEITTIKQIVRNTKPSLVFVAFGSPAQELWIEANKALFKGSLVIGVGGSFAMLSHVLPRAPVIIRKLGFEWLFRLIQEPWRFRRQKQLLNFVALVLRQKFKL